jgi:hypothetical protein
MISDINFTLLYTGATLTIHLHRVPQQKVPSVLHEHGRVAGDFAPQPSQSNPVRAGGKVMQGSANTRFRNQALPFARNAGNAACRLVRLALVVDSLVD